MEVLSQTDAKKKPIDRNEAISLLSAASEVYVVKGKKSLHFDMATASLEDVLAAALGPTGNLRAPAFRTGSTLVVGYDAETYSRALAISSTNS